MACRFGSPALVTSLSGIAASPTLSVDAANSYYLGISGSFTSDNGAACSFPTQYITQEQTSTYAITPIIIAAGRTATCSVLAPPSITPNGSGSITYSDFECPSIMDNQFAPGSYTLGFDQPKVTGAPTISSLTFIVVSPTFSTDHTTTTVNPTATPPITLVPVVTSSTATTTLTDVVSSFAATTEEPRSLVAFATSSTPASTINLDPPVSSNGECGSSSNQTCAGSTFGSCCSLYGYCGNSDIYCLSTEGCQFGYGECTIPSSVSSSSPTPTSTDKVSLDGSCGGDNGYVCPGSGLGDCCSPYGWCGSSDSHCGAGCQNAFGICSGPTPTGTAPLPTSTQKVSLDGACGGTAGQTCLGSNFGACCSEYGYCGSTDVYCTGACQPTFGICNTSSVKRSAPKGNLRAASFAAVKRSAGHI